MQRRTFFTAALAAGATSLSTVSAQTGGNREYIEILRYHTAANGKRGPLNDYFKSAFIPALNRLGVKNVGVANPTFGDSSNTTYVFLPHPSLESWAGWRDKLLHDRTYLDAAKAVADAPFTDPAYVRIEGWLLHAFSGMPKLEIPAMDTRIFEMRIYQSHTMTYSKKKIKMFNEGGEIAIFRKTGLTPVFFAEMLSGPKMPCLVYMVVHKDMTDREQNWAKFRVDPAWQALRTRDEFRNTVSSITDIVMSPAGYSQI